MGKLCLHWWSCSHGRGHQRLSKESEQKIIKCFFLCVYLIPIQEWLYIVNIGYRVSFFNIFGWWCGLWFRLKNTDVDSVWLFQNLRHSDVSGDWSECMNIMNFLNYYLINKKNKHLIIPFSVVVLRNFTWLAPLMAAICPWGKYRSMVFKIGF